MAFMRSTYITIVYIVPTNKPPTEKPRAVTRALALVPVAPKPKPRAPPSIDSNPDFDADATVSLTNLDKGKGKAIDPPEDPNGGPAPRVRTTFLLNNVLTIQAELYSYKTEGGEPSLGSHVPRPAIDAQVVC